MATAACTKDGAGWRDPVGRRVVNGGDAAALKTWLALKNFCGHILAGEAEAGEGDEVTDTANGFPAVSNPGEGEVYCLAITSQTRRAFGEGVG
ncbi:MAG TPA: hypothetical protein VNM48_10560 [Chloroflexota bacterium]|nr:hypothetical protein [Chloroflexota bacterium]